MEELDISSLTFLKRSSCKNFGKVIRSSWNLTSVFYSQLSAFVDFASLALKFILFCLSLFTALISNRCTSKIKPKGWNSSHERFIDVKLTVKRDSMNIYWAVNNTNETIINNGEKLLIMEQRREDFLLRIVLNNKWFLGKICRI